MSSAHRPTWDPAKGRADSAHATRIVGSRQLPSQTKLKFRQPGQGGSIPVGTALARDEWRRRDLKKELEEAERDAKRKRRRDEGGTADDEEEQQQPVAAIGASEGGEDEETKRRKLLQQAAELDKDEESSDDDDDGESDAGAKAGNGKAKAAGSDSDSDSDSDDSDDDEDETAALLRELEKIKRERAEEKARQERERNEAEQSSREDEIALGNPLLNLENAMKGGPGSTAAASRSGAPSASDFGVKRRWDDDVIFKNQAAGNDGGDKSGFINDLARSEFHKRFLYRYIK